MAKKKIGQYQEANGRYVYKTSETYKGISWVCKGTSMKSYDIAVKSWQSAKERKIAEIDGNINKKEGKIKLSESLTAWYDMYKRHEVNKGRKRSARTINTDLDTIKQIDAVLGDTFVCDIDSDTLQAYFLRLVEDGLSTSTIKKRWNMLAMFFAHTYPDGGNPMTRCKRPDSDKEEQTWAIHDDDEPTSKLAYTSAEAIKLSKELSKPYNYHSGWKSTDRGYSVGNALIVCMREFLRVGELVELRVKDVDFDKNLIYVRRQYDEVNKLITIPKYGSKRKVPIALECREIIKMACEGKTANELLFRAGEIYNPDKLTHGGHILRGRLRDNLDLACKRTGLERHTIHDLRHDGISRLVDAGAKPQSIKRWAGHKTLSVTLDKYYRDSKDEDIEDMKLMTGVAG